MFKESWFLVGIWLVMVFLAGYAFFYFALAVPVSAQLEAGQQRIQELQKSLVKDSGSN